MHHHVALDEPGDIERLYRFVNGTALGLIACGGGAYCAAHVGLYKALLQSGLAFDIMGGTSGGGAMTAAFAMGTDPDDVDRATHEIFVTNKAMRRYTWPRYSLLDHTHFDRQLANHYAGIDIEDLWIPYFAVSTNLSSYDLHRHRRGDLWAAVRATGSIPVLLPPYYTEDGHMLVDGAIMDNVPVRVDARAEERAQRRRQLRGAEARTLRGRLPRAARAQPPSQVRWSRHSCAAPCRRRPASAPC